MPLTTKSDVAKSEPEVPAGMLASGTQLSGANEALVTERVRRVCAEKKERSPTVMEGLFSVPRTIM